MAENAETQRAIYYLVINVESNRTNFDHAGSLSSNLVWVTILLKLLPNPGGSSNQKLGVDRSGQLLDMPRSARLAAESSHRHIAKLCRHLPSLH